MYQFVFKLVLILVSSFFVLVVVSEDKIHTVRKRSATCILPPYPDKGRYEVAGDPTAKPGDVFEFAYLNVSCNRGARVIGDNVMLCVQGEWSRTMPQCQSVCPLTIYRSVKYTCKRPNSDSFGECEDYEPVGTRVRPQCREGYYSASALPIMLCIGEAWDYIAKCTPECGILPGNGNTVPWYAYIYEEAETFWRGICGGTVISNTVVVSAAHCFWRLSLRKAEDFLVVVQPSSPILDIEANLKNKSSKLNQTSYISKHEVRQINVPSRYMDVITNYQQDIALLTLKKPVVFSATVMPVCLNFDYEFNLRQMRKGNNGTVAVWSSPVTESSVLSIHNYPYIPIAECADMSPASFKEFLTGDKFCAGLDNNRTKITKGNSGSGLTFPDEERGLTRHYLRGVVSTAPMQEDPWAPTDFVTFTKITSHEHFIKGLL
uniref:Peptidase S1 domain-containing protein n=1 Tax=Heliothis virescens TaxID=7102 RepID=A0A2A4J979_HELVI